MLYGGENTPGVAINEAVELAKKYGSDEDYQFINGLLGPAGPGAGAGCRTAAGAGRTVSRYTLGIDTSNYATSLAVFDTAGEVVCAKKRFLPVKQGQLGLRQSDALFHHTAALPEMLAQLNTEFDLTQIQAVGVSQRPRPVEGSYMPCFWPESMPPKRLLWRKGFRWSILRISKDMRRLHCLQQKAQSCFIKRYFCSTFLAEQRIFCSAIR